MKNFFEGRQIITGIYKVFVITSLIKHSFSFFVLMLTLHWVLYIFRWVFVRIMGNQNMKGHYLWPKSCLPSIVREVNTMHQGENGNYSGESDESADSCGNDKSSLLCSANELENIIINNDSDHLSHLIQCQTDINIPLNEKGETALILSVKLSHITLVKILLSHPECNKNSLNINNCSALDLAMITAFDNRLEPRHSICWEIIKCLMETDSEPVCKDAMMYVVRTALKLNDEQFLFKLINCAIQYHNSIKFHELLLQKLHRHQPIYMGSIDPFLNCVSDFSVKLLKGAKYSDLEYIVNSLIYYLESYWNSRKEKFVVFRKLILYTSAAGWVWTRDQLAHLSKVSPHLTHWCIQQKMKPMSLTHLTRVVVRRNLNCHIGPGLLALPDQLPVALQKYVGLQDMDEISENPDIKLIDVCL